MRNLIIICLLLLTFAACEKQDLQKEKIFNIELRGAFIVKYVLQPDGSFKTVDVENIDYTLQIIVNGVIETQEIKESLNAGFVGVVFEKTLNLKENDTVILKIRNNSYPTSAHIYLRSNFDKLDFEEYGEFNL